MFWKKKKMSTNDKMIELTDKIMESEAYIEHLETVLSGNLSTKTRDIYRGRLKTARNRLTKLENLLKDELEVTNNEITKKDKNRHR